MHVHFTYAGGTIGMVDSPRGLRPGADLEAWLSDLLIAFPTASRPRTTLTTLQPLVDSAQAAPHTWQAIINDINAHACADAFLVLHGTDTLAYTASALSYALTGLRQPVVATGSQLPLGAPGSDAAANVTGALEAIAQGVSAGVHLFFGGHLLAGNRATKTSAWSLQGFDSPNVAPSARAGAPWHWSGPTDTDGIGWSTPRPFGQHDVVVLDAVPGLTATRLAALLAPPPVGVVLRAFGVGNLPTELTPVIADAVTAGVTVVITSQCLQGTVALDRYAVGTAVAATGAVGGGDMTMEAAYTKLQFLASQGLRGAELGAWMRRNLAGELTMPRV
ncbi:asparaginase [Actinomyces sp.]|uniref:asparaginase n=1 Tax=Actinomyces sp. TaxID=29317 RepID=UPI0026DC328B|nr:asparaginase [Actinomyces sp.]MDO4899725.1 asparaginase [Actinomyces sp.]